MTSIWHLLAGVLGAVLLYKKIFGNGSQSEQRTQMPLLGISRGEKFAMLRGQYRYVTNGYNLIFEAFQSANPSQGKFQIPSCWDQLFVFSAAYIDEIKTVSASIMDIQSATGDRFLTSYVGLPVQEVLDNITRSTIQHQLLSVQKLRSHFPGLLAACMDACKDVFPLQGEESLSLRDALREISLRTVGQIFVGPELSRNRVWYENAGIFLDAVTIFSLIMQLVPPLLRPLLARLLPLYWRMKSTERKLRHILTTALKKKQHERKILEHAKQTSNPGDLFDWLLDVDGSRAQADKNVINRQLALCFAGPHTLSFDMERVVTDLAEFWDEITPVLAEECQSVLEVTHGTFDMLFLDRLSSLDEFMVWSWEKDARRAAAFHRRILQQYTLKDGTTLPKGAMIMAFSGNSLDAPAAFRPSKNLNHRDRAGKPHNRYASVGTSYTNFGDGRHSCPGRRLATVVEKMILLYIICNYDVRLDNPPRHMIFEDTKANAPDVKIRVLKRAEPRFHLFKS